MSDRSQIMSIRQLLESQELYPPNDCLFVEHGEISLGSRCLVDPADLYNVDYVPPLAVENDLKYIIMMDTYSDVMQNLQDQIKNPSTDQKFQALIFYFENDGFIVLE